MVRFLHMIFILPALLAAPFTGMAKALPPGEGESRHLIEEFHSAPPGEGAVLLLSLGPLLSAEEAGTLIASPSDGGSRTAAEYYLLAAALRYSLGERCRRPESVENGGKITGGGKPPPAVTAAVDFLSQHVDWRLRLAAAGLLPCLGGGRITPAHRRLAADGEWPVKHRAIASLSSLPRGENIVILDGILRDRGEAALSERVEAVRAMDRLRHLPGLLKALGDSSREVRLHAIWGLDRFPIFPVEAKPTLEKLLNETSDERERAEIRQLLKRRLPPSTEGTR